MHVARVLPYLQRSRSSTSYSSYFLIFPNTRRRFLDHVHFVSLNIPGSWFSVDDIGRWSEKLEIP